MYAIKRFQAGSGTWCWVVNFSRRGVHHERRFYEPKHGGSDAALRAVIAWRDERLTKAEVLGVLEFCQLKRSNNGSGVPGVHFLTPAAQPEGIWQAKLKLADGTRWTRRRTAAGSSMKDCSVGRLIATDSGHSVPCVRPASISQLRCRPYSIGRVCDCLRSLMERNSLRR